MWTEQDLINNIKQKAPNDPTGPDRSPDTSRFSNRAQLLLPSARDIIDEALAKVDEDSVEVSVLADQAYKLSDQDKDTLHRALSRSSYY